MRGGSLQSVERLDRLKEMVALRNTREIPMDLDGVRASQSSDSAKPIIIREDNKLELPPVPPINNDIDFLRVASFTRGNVKPRQIPLVDVREAERRYRFGTKVDVSSSFLYDKARDWVYKLPALDGNGKTILKPGGAPMMLDYTFRQILNDPGLLKQALEGVLPRLGDLGGREQIIQEIGGVRRNLEALQEAQMLTHGLLDNLQEQISGREAVDKSIIDDVRKLVNQVDSAEYKEFVAEVESGKEHTMRDIVDRELYNPHVIRYILDNVALASNNVFNDFVSFLRRTRRGSFNLYESISDFNSQRIEVGDGIDQVLTDFRLPVEAVEVDGNDSVLGQRFIEAVYTQGLVDEFRQFYDVRVLSDSNVKVNSFYTREGVPLTAERVMFLMAKGFGVIRALNDMTTNLALVAIGRGREDNERLSLEVEEKRDEPDDESDSRTIAGFPFNDDESSEANSQQGMGIAVDKYKMNAVFKKMGLPAMEQGLLDSQYLRGIQAAGLFAVLEKALKKRGILSKKNMNDKFGEGFYEDNDPRFYEDLLRGLFRVRFSSKSQRKFDILK